MQKEIKKLAIELYNKTLEEFLSSKESFKEILERNLSKYNKSVLKLLKEAIYSLFSSSLTKDIEELLPTEVALSKMLYKNAKEAESNILRLFKSNSKKTIKDIALMLYEGYGFREKEVLEVRKLTPLYVQKYLEKRLNQKRFEKDINKLKTKPLRTAYKQLAEVAQKHDKEATKKALKVALEEKARYYANRIAVTEQQRALNLGRAKEYLEDEEIEFVRYRMSSKHPMIDICDYFANLNIGYGKGIVPKEKMITLPLHPHCMCRYEPYYRDVEYKKVKEPEKTTLEKFSKEEQRQILGSWEAYKEFKEKGNILNIFNKNRPKYPIQNVAKVLNVRMNNLSTVDKIKQMLNDIKAKTKLVRNSIIVGFLSEDIINTLKENNITIHTEEIYLTAKGLAHLSRDSKKKRGASLSEDDILRIPDILENFTDIYLEVGENKFNIIYCDFKSKKCIKLVVDTKAYSNRKEKITLIKTAGYIKRGDMNNTRIYKHIYHKSN